jgi:ankyrin repeat protein
MRDRTELRAAAIHLASFNGNVKLMKYLVENEADLSSGTSFGVSALHMAAQGD